MSTSTNTNTRAGHDRFLPYAKDHDRLQLALLYMEAESECHRGIETQLQRLQRDKGTIERSLEHVSKMREATIKQYIHENHPAEYIDSKGKAVDLGSGSQTAKSKEELKESCDREMERVFGMEQCELKALAFVEAKIEMIKEEKEWLIELDIQKEKIRQLIEELHGTAFDGDTPEFPHEDQLEALVKVAEAAFKSEQAAFDKFRSDDSLGKLERIASSAYTKLQHERPLSPSTFLLKEFQELKMHEKCNSVTQQFQAWEEGFKNYISEHPGFLHPCVRVMPPELDPNELIERLSGAADRDGRYRYVELAVVRCGHRAIGEIRAASKDMEKIKSHAVKNAKIMLKLRRRQLAAARSQILDHVIDPDKCPLEQRAEELPDYPEQISIHNLPRWHPLVPRLLAESETYPVEAYVNDVINSRLNRARRTTHPPILETARYQPPMYDELEDPELVRGRYEREVPPIEGDTPEYTEEPDYDGHIQTEASEVGPIVRFDLEELVNTARLSLGLKSNAQRNQFNDMLTMVSGILGGTGTRVLMPGPGARF